NTTAQREPDAGGDEERYDNAMPGVLFSDPVHDLQLIVDAGHRNKIRVSSRAAETARDLTSGLWLSRNAKQSPSSNARHFAVAEIATERSLGALRQPRDDML